jgi:hypothetical protein
MRARRLHRPAVFRANGAFLSPRNKSRSSTAMQFPGRKEGRSPHGERRRVETDRRRRPFRGGAGTGKRCLRDRTLGDRPHRGNGRSAGPTVRRDRPWRRPPGPTDGPRSSRGRPRGRPPRRGPVRPLTVRRSGPCPYPADGRVGRSQAVLSRPPAAVLTARSALEPRQPRSAASVLVSPLAPRIVSPNVYSNGGPFTRCSYVCSN